MRLDKYLVDRGYFSSRARAKEAIENGKVTLERLMVRKPDIDVADGALVEVSEGFPWVGRGALKLIGALGAFHIDPTGLSVLDLGASTGGFTQVLLDRGATKVYAVDIGHGQLHPLIAGDPRVANMEGTDMRDLETKALPTPFPLIVADLSFISLSHAFPVIKNLLSPKGDFVALLKPQFEVGKGKTKKGIVKDPDLHGEVLRSVREAAQAHGLEVMSVILSPIEGGSGNKEYLLHLKKVS